MYNTYCTIFTNIPNFNHSNRYTLSKQNFTIIKIKRIFFPLNYTKYSIHKYHFCFSKQNSNKYTSIILSFNFKERRNTHIEEVSPQTSLRENVEINRVFNLTRLAINAHRVSPLLKCPSTFNSTRFNRIQPIYIYIFQPVKPARILPPPRVSHSRYWRKISIPFLRRAAKINAWFLPSSPTFLRKRLLVYQLTIRLSGSDTVDATTSPGKFS